MADLFAETEKRFRVRADIDLGEFYERLRAEALQQFTDLYDQGVRGEELADRVVGALNNLSDRPVEEAARGAASRAFNLGRNLQIQKNAAGIKEVVRTEILDENTCDPCRLLDGAVYAVGSAEYLQDMPPAHCEGRDLCRGFYLARAA